MRSFTCILSCMAMCAILFSSACSNDKDSNPTPPPPPPGEVTITGIGGEPLFWGDVMTIHGTGFSTTAADNVVRIIPETNSIVHTCGLKLTTAGGDVEMISASATEIKIRVPYSGDCGPERVGVEVTVKDKKATLSNIKFIGLPYLKGFNYHYGWVDHTRVTRIGDSVMIDAGLRGLHARESGYWNSLSLTISGESVPIKYRKIGSKSGFAFFLDGRKWASGSCDEAPDGWAARELTFTLHVGSTGKSATIQLYVQNSPSRTASCLDCPTRAQIGAGAEARWNLEGHYVSMYSKVVFSPTATDPANPCTGTAPQSVTLMSAGDHKAHAAIPLATLLPCGYAVYISDDCNRSELLGFL